MSVSKKAIARIAPILFTLAACTPAIAWADPVRITVQFSLMGDHEAGGTSPSDPDNGNRTASGSFSIVATPPAGEGSWRTSRAVFMPTRCP